MRQFLKTVAVVTVFSVSEKVLGFLYRIFLSRSIGTEGIGLYQVALSMFGLIFTISCSGVPVTVSRLMTKYKAENKTSNINKVITAGFCTTLFVALPLTLLILIFKNKLSFLFADNRSLDIFLLICPGLIFSAIYSVMRGVFWGSRDFLPYSVIELLEEIVMILSGIVLISLSTSAFSGAYRAGVAVLISYAFSFTASIIVFIIRKHKLDNPLSEFKPLLSASIPITSMRTASSFAVSFVSVILPIRLISAGFTESEAISMFGAAAGQTVPLLTIPTTLISSFTIVLIPEISQNFYAKKYHYLKTDIEKAIKLCLVLSCLFVPIFCALGNEIGILVFKSKQCGEYLTVSSLLMVFIATSNITTSILNSMGFENRTLIYFMIGGALMLLSIWFLPKFINIYALLLGFSFVYVVTTVCNLILLNKKCKEKPCYIKFMLSLFLSIIPSTLFGFLLKNLMIKAVGLILALIITSASIFIFNVLLYLTLGLIDVDMINLVREKISKPKQKISPEI